MSIKKENSDELMDEHDWLDYIMSLYGEELTRVAYLYLKEWKLAEDAVQETFIKCFLKREQFRGDSSLKTWIYSILINTCKDVLKSGAYRKVIILNNINTKLLPSVESSENVAIKRERELILSQSVLSLPLKYREVITLFYYKGFSIKEIGNTLKINESTVRVRLNRAREKLSKTLTQGGNIDEK